MRAVFQDGGLADVVGALPKEIKKSGVDVRVITPLYSAIPKNGAPKWSICSISTSTSAGAGSMWH
jgi:glycogen synthase